MWYLQVVEFRLFTILGLQPRDKAAMLVVNTKEIFLLNLHQNRVHFPAERNAFVLDPQHGRRDVACKPAIPKRNSGPGNGKKRLSKWKVKTGRSLLSGTKFQISFWWFTTVSVYNWRFIFNLITLSLIRLQKLGSNRFHGNCSCVQRTNFGVSFVCAIVGWIWIF